MRIGKNKFPKYRIIAIESHKKQTSNYIDKLGTYDPMLAENTVQLDTEKFIAWINKGAQLSEGAHKLLKNYLPQK